MVKKIFLVIQEKGIIGLFKAIYYRVFPKRLKYFSDFQSIFQTGIGLEVGGPSSIFNNKGFIPIYPIAIKIDNCNFGHYTVWEDSINEGHTFVFNKQKAAGKQYIAEASNLNLIKDSTYDFVLSSHCVEHLANPLLGLSEWIRVLKDDGLLVLVIPHKDGTFDHNRSVTSLDHLIQDFNQVIGEDDMTHLHEILKFHDFNMDSDAGDFNFFEARSKKNLENRCLHHHVFDTRLAIEVVNYMRLQILAVETTEPFHIVIIAKKETSDQNINNEKFRRKNGGQCWSSLFPSDTL